MLSKKQTILEFFSTSHDLTHKIYQTDAYILIIKETYLAGLSLTSTLQLLTLYKLIMVIKLLSPFDSLVTVLVLNVLVSLMSEIPSQLQGPRNTS